MKNLFLLSICTLLLVSCSRLKIAVDWADTFVLAGMEDYYEFSSHQSAQFKKEFRTILKDVEKSDFREFASLLEAIVVSVEKNELSRDVIKTHLEQGRGILQKAIYKFEPLIQRVNDEQASSNFEKYDREFKTKLAEDYKDLGNQKKAMKKHKASFDFWIDQSIEFLTETQEESLTKQLLETQPPTRLRLDSKNSVHEKFVMARSDSVARKAFISKFMSSWESLQTEVYLNARKPYQEKLLDWMHQVAQTLTEKQKQNIIKNLKKRAGEFRSLSEAK